MGFLKIQVKLPAKTALKQTLIDGYKSATLNGMKIRADLEEEAKQLREEAALNEKILRWFAGTADIGGG